MAEFVHLAGPPVLRPAELALFDNDYMEKRQLYLRSYRFSRKQTTAYRIRGSLVRVRRLVWVKLRAARRLVWLRLRHVSCMGGRFHRLHVPPSRSRGAASSCWGPLWS